MNEGSTVYCYHTILNSNLEYKYFCCCSHLFCFVFVILVNYLVGYFFLTFITADFVSCFCPSSVLAIHFIFTCIIKEWLKG